MQENERKVIAVDLDGTTLENNGVSVSNFTIETFKKVQEAGHTIVIATGRPYRMAIDIYKTLGLTSPMVTFNGALLSMPGNKEWEHTHKRYIKKELVFDLLTHQQTFSLNFLAAEYRRKFFINNFQGVDPSIFGVEAFEPFNRLRPDRLTSDPHALLLSTRAKDKVIIQHAIQDHFNNQVTVSSWGGPNGILEIVPRGVNKAYALKRLLKTLDVPRENLIAFGDEFNDVEMFQLAQTGCAMKNASERLVGHADEILPWTNQEDGVARKLEELFL